MYHIVSHFRQLLTSEDGPAAVEYAVTLSLILVACIAIVTTLGQFHEITTQFKIPPSVRAA